MNAEQNVNAANFAVSAASISIAAWQAAPIMSRKLVLQLLAHVQSGGVPGMQGVIVGKQMPERLVPFAQLSTVGEAQGVWAMFIFAPEPVAQPEAAWFAENPQLMRLVASPATKGVLQLLAWRHDAQGQLSNVPMQMID